MRRPVPVPAPYAVTPVVETTEVVQPIVHQAVTNHVTYAAAPATYAAHGYGYAAPATYSGLGYAAPATYAGLGYAAPAEW